ncbi:MAG: glycosyltransferase family 2 protein [Ktedonobacteraceae bacterium]
MLKRLLQWQRPLSIVFFLGCSCGYIMVMLLYLNTQLLWLSIPYAVASILFVLAFCLTCVNGWKLYTPSICPLLFDDPPPVAVLIPTCGEPVLMVRKTIESVLAQWYPQEKLTIVVGDDSHRIEMRTMVQNLSALFLKIRILYMEPPRHGDPARQGRAKDGNLNAMLAFIHTNFPNIRYIETRDADDLVGDVRFLRACIGYLIGNPMSAYVQTIKEIRGKRDPFDNKAMLFYKGMLLARSACNAVFPCGSGLVWKIDALQSIGGFPTWNCVEDLYSGYLALQHGFTGGYIPIVGAVAQSVPEDIPNIYKQRGTWAIDTLRIFFWRNPFRVKGLTLVQRLQFLEVMTYYLLAFPLFVLIIVGGISGLLQQSPLLLPGVFALLPIVYCLTSLLMLSMLYEGIAFFETIRALNTLYMLMFVFMKGCVLALLYGPNKKPTYKVTRKNRERGIYLRFVLQHLLLVVFLLLSVIRGLFAWTEGFSSENASLILWCVFHIVLFLPGIQKSWHGYRVRDTLQVVAGKVVPIEHDDIETKVASLKAIRISPLQLPVRKLPTTPPPPTWKLPTIRLPVPKLPTTPPPPN